MAPTPAGVCIDRYEASAGKGNLGDPDGQGTTLVAESKPGAMPLVEVTLAQAARACENAKKRLCTSDEWLSACRGPNRLEYSYGNEYEPKRCRDWHASDEGRSGPAKTGSYPRCNNADGVFDLTNNVGEWTSTKERGDLWAVRGGTFNMVVHDSGCGRTSYVVPKTARQNDLGFRCCAAPLAEGGGADSKAPATK